MLGVAEALFVVVGRVINRPGAILRTERDGTSALIAPIPGIVVPTTSRHTALDAVTLMERLRSSPSGLIVRRVGSQTGQEMLLVRAADQVPAVLDAMGGSACFCIDYHDFADTAGRFSKMRFFRIRSEVYPEHRITANSWNIHSADRYRLMKADTALQQDEQRFLSDPAAVIGTGAIDAIRSAFERTGLEYCGIDFAQLRDGRMLVFELNASMRLNYDHVAPFPYLRHHLDAARTAFQNLVLGQH